MYTGSLKWNLIVSETYHIAQYTYVNASVVYGFYAGRIQMFALYVVVYNVSIYTNCVEIYI